MYFVFILHVLSDKYNPFSDEFVCMIAKNQKNKNESAFSLCAHTVLCDDFIERVRANGRDRASKKSGVMTASFDASDAFYAS